MYQNDPLSLLNQLSYGTYNRQLAKEIGLNAAVLLAELVEKRSFHINELTFHPNHGDGWFYFTIDHLEDRIGLSRKEQDTALKKLEERGLIEHKVFGLPAKRHFRLNDENILSIYGLSKSKSSLSECYKQACEKGTNRRESKGQTSHIYQEPKEEPNEQNIARSDEKDAKCAQSVSSKPLHARKCDIVFSPDKRIYENITDEDMKAWKALYGSVDINREIAASIQWLLANPSKARKTNWRKFLVGWLGRANETASNRSAYASIAKVDRRTQNKDGTPVEVDYGW